MDRMLKIVAQVPRLLHMVIKDVVLFRLDFKKMRPFLLAKGVD